MMTGNKLMGAVLQLAMQGKIVEQRPEEGTGEELYQKIRLEKDRLIKRGVLKKNKKSEEISDDEKHFDIPESWKWVRVEDIAILNPKNDLEDDIDTSFIPMTLVDDAFSNHHTSERRRWGEIKKGFSHFAEGDIGVAKITPCFQNRKSVIFRNLINGYGAGTTELSIVRPFKNHCSPEYLLYIFKSELFINNGVKSFTGTAGQQRIHKDYLRRFAIPLPPLAEQKRIVAKIEELMPFVEQYAVASTKLNALNASFPEMMKKSILQEAVQGKLVPQDPNDEPASVLLEKIAQKCIIPSELENEINDNYKYAHLVDACLGIYDCPHSTPTYSETFQGYLCLRTRELEVGEIEWDKLLYLTEDTYKERITRYKPKKGDIVYAREGRYGICAVIDRDTPLALGQRLMVFSVNHEILRSEYLFYVLISDFCLKQVTSAQRGMTAAHVNVKDIKKMIVPIPSLKTQDAIINVLDKLLNKIDLLKVKNNE